MKEREVQLNAEDLIGAVEDVRDHVRGTEKLTLRSTHVAIPKATPQNRAGGDCRHPKSVEGEPARFRPITQRAESHRCKLGKRPA